MPNPVCAQKSGYFKYKVQSYGTFSEQSEYYFKAYTDEEAKNIGNYTVYGLCGLKEVAAVAPISQMAYIYMIQDLKLKNLKNQEYLIWTVS